MATDYLSLIEEANNFLSELTDDEELLEIDDTDRVIKIPNGFNKQIAISNDQNSEIVTFLCPKVIEGYDVYQNLIDNKLHCFVKWENFNGEVGTYEISKIVESSSEKMTLEWVVERSVAAVEGQLKFSIGFYGYSVNDSIAQEIYCW